MYTVLRMCYTPMEFKFSFSNYFWHQLSHLNSSIHFRRFRNNLFWHNFFRFHGFVFFFIEKKLHRFVFLQFSSIYLSISKLLRFSLNSFHLLQFTSCSKFLSPIFSFFLTSHSCLTFNFVEKNLTNGSHPHLSQRRRRYHGRRF